MGEGNTTVGFILGMNAVDVVEIHRTPRPWRPVEIFVSRLNGGSV